MRIHHVALTVDNLEESIDFYTDVFGCSVAQQFEREDLNAKAAFLELDGLFLELWQFEDSAEQEDIGAIKKKGIRHVAFAVGDLDKQTAELKEKGIEYREPTMGASGHRYTFINDPSGIALELYEVGDKT
jgi:glyoxylase I family protein